MVLLVAPIGSVVADPAADPLLTSWPVDLAGVSEVQAADAAVLLDPTGSWSSLRLQAQTVVIDMDWERGVHGGEIVSLVEETGQESLRFDESEVTFEPFRVDPVLLAHPGEGPSGVEFTSVDPVSTSSVADALLASVGLESGTMSDGDRPFGFSFTAEGPSVRVEGPGAVRVEGDFSVFVHDLRFHVSGTNAQWSDWTGLHEEPSDLPVTQYEFRVTTFKVTNGTLAVTSAEPVELYAPSVAAHVDGLVSSSSVTGRFVTQTGVFVFEQDPFRLRGSGDLFMDAVADRQGHGLEVRPVGDFEVQGAGVMEDLPVGGPGWGGVLAFVSAAALLAVVGLAGLGVVPVPLEASRRIRHARWMRWGQRASEAGRFERAASWFRRAVRVKGDDPVAWYEWAHAELEAGRGDRADQVAEAALGVQGMDRLDVLDLRAAAAWQQGDRDRFEDYLIELADAAPEMASRLVVDLGVEISSLGLETRLRLKGGGTEGEIDGYA